ncbi:Maf1 regulator-domain-containing protein [Jimgerdemannia flammicorona]|uniref:Repressor of RNA polymerase III transcription MAF1 n=1 Tax=Jimgerdemannia flammicorona TaxID=994334 RepID=A0A433D517_9FUNG|nr:Maf1 regulator-domain-containing protein [Jimgerdemannia flammicorona]
MKYLEVPALDAVNNILSWETPECKIFGRVEAYSCKSAGTDKKLFKQLETRYTTDLSTSQGSFSPEDHFHMGSPFGPMDQPSSRKTLFYLIGTLNSSFPDYDFSEVKPEQFSKQPSCQLVINSVNNTLFNMGNERIVKDLRLWDVIDNIIDLNDCNVYSYNPDMDDDPNGEEGSIWSLNYFFFNRNLKRMVFFSLRSLSPNAPMQEGEDLDAFSDSEIDPNREGYAYQEYVMGDMEGL